MRLSHVVLAAWLVCAIMLSLSARLGGAAAPVEEKEPYEAITDKEIASIPFEDYSIDNDFVTPVAKDLTNLDDEAKKRLDEMTDKLDQWEPGHDKKIGQQVRNWMALCTLHDLGHGEFEAELPYVIFERLRKDVPQEKLKKALAWIVLKPTEGKVIRKAPEVGVEEEADEGDVRERHAVYAAKLLGRVLGKLPIKDP